ncbi:unnamed protein product [Effrenium voratum]|nr:unnamed protein product [Effrenium voratum]
MAVWVRSEAEKAIVGSTIDTIIIATCSGWAGVFIFTFDFWLAVIVTCVVLVVITGLAFFIVCIMGWAIGPIEVISLVVFVGYSVTYALHIAHNYNQMLASDKDVLEAEEKARKKEMNRNLAKAARERAARGQLDDDAEDVADVQLSVDNIQVSPEDLHGPLLRKARTRVAVLHVGGATLSSALSTAGSSAFLLFCTLTIFVKLGAVVVAVTVLSILGAIVTLPAALMLVRLGDVCTLINAASVDECSACGWACPKGDSAETALQLAGFQEDTEGFFLPWVRPGALRQVHAALRRQATLAGAAKAKPRPALASSKPKFDENLLREIQAEAQYQAQLRTPGAPSAPKPAPAAARSTGDLRLRLRVQLMGSLELKVPSTTRVADFQGQIKQLTGVPSHHQRVRFGFPSRVLEGNDASLADVGLQDGELLILEDLHDLFLGNLESGQFTMEEMLGKLPPVSEEESTESLFFDVLSAFQIGMLEMDFWRTMRRKLREALAGKEEEMEKLAVGLYKLQRLFRHHDSRQRLHLILSSLPRSRHANKMNVKRSSFLFSVACQVGDMERGAMLSRLCISYDGEKGVDAGGLTRDFFTSFGLHLAEEPNLFQPTGRGGLHPTRRSRPKQPTDLRTPSHLMYKVCGRVFAMAILHGCKVGRRLSRPFVRNLLGAASSLTLQELQEELNFEAGEERDFRGSQEFLEKPLKELGLEGVLTFQNQGEELEPGGAQREVTDENKEDWLMKTLRWELFGAANYAAGWFRAGLIDVLGGHKTICPLLCLFDAGDLMELWGTGGIARQELKQWKAVTSLNPSIQQQGAWFWQVLEEDFDDELRGKVLQFATGSSSIGRQGLVDFRLEPGDGGDGRLPTAMTCGHLLQLPRYSSRQQLRRQLQQAVESTGSFEML